MHRGGLLLRAFFARRQKNRAGECRAGDQVSTYGWGRRVLIQGVLDVFLRIVVGLLKAAHR